MQTESRPFFDADTARHASLTATLRRVRVRRRARKTVRCTAAFALIAVPLWLLRLPPSGHGHTVAENPLIIHTRPLTIAQTVRSIPAPDICIRTSREAGRTARITTPSDAAVPRLADVEFHQLLAAHEVGCIQVAGIPAMVFPLRPAANDDRP